MREALSTGIGLVFVAVLLVSIVTLWRSHLHPVQLALRTVSGASMIGILGLVGVLPAMLWWMPWLLGLGMLVGSGRACRRLLGSAPPAEPTPAQAKLLARPSTANVVVESALCLVLLGVAATAG